MRAQYQSVPSTPNMGAQIRGVKGPVGQITDTSERAIKDRLRDSLDDLGGKSAGFTLQKVAELTGENYKNVQRWVAGDTTLPAHFVARFAAALPVDAGWILTGISSERAPARHDGPDRGPRPISSAEWEDLRTLLDSALSALTVARRRVVESATGEGGGAEGAARPGLASTPEPTAPQPDRLPPPAATKSRDDVDRQLYEMGKALKESPPPTPVDSERPRQSRRNDPRTSRG